MPSTTLASESRRLFCRGLVEDLASETDESRELVDGK